MDKQLSKTQQQLDDVLVKSLGAIKARDPETYRFAEQDWKERQQQELGAISYLKAREFELDCCDRLVRRRPLTK